MTVISVFGDSIAWGSSDPLGGWVARLLSYLEEENPDTIVHNQSVSGNTTRDLLSRFDCDIKGVHPDIIIFSIGINDSIIDEGEMGNRVEKEIFAQNIHALLEKAAKTCSRIFVVGLIQVDESLTKPVLWDDTLSYDNASIAEYNKILRDSADKNHVHFIDVWNTLLPKDLADGLHPNASGHEKLFRTIAHALEELEPV